MRICILLLLLVLTVGPSIAQSGSSGQKIELEESFYASGGQQLELHLTTPATVQLTGWDKQEVVVKVKMEGKYLDVVCRQEDGVVKVISRFTQVADGSFSRGTIEIKLPYQLAVKGQLLRGDLTLRELRGETHIETGQGFVTGYDLQGGLQLIARDAHVELYGGHIEGNIFVQNGSVKVADVHGTFTAAGDGGQFSVNSFAEPVNGQIGAEQMALSVSEGDVEARAYRSTMDVTWNGSPERTNHKLLLSGTDSKMTLYVPAALGMDAFLEQVSSEKKAPSPSRPPKDAKPPVSSSLESDFDLGTLPPAKNFTHQGKTLKLVQVQKKLNKGGNRLEIRAADSQVKLKKIKQI